MEYELRTYTAKPGVLGVFVEEWRQHVLPLRRAKGFEVVGAWRSDEDDLFVWLLAYDGDFDEADRAYYDSPERKAIDPDPARHLARTAHQRLRSAL